MKKSIPDSASQDLEQRYSRLTGSWSAAEIAAAASSLEKQTGRIPRESDVETYLLAESLGVQPSIMLNTGD